MLDNFTRPLKEKILIPCAEFTGRFLSPNQISVIAFLSGLIGAAAVFKNNMTAGIIFWLLNRILDGLDGTVARVTGKMSDFGGYLDLMLDLILYVLIPVAFVYNGIVNNGMGIELLWACLILFGIFYINLGSWALLSALIEKKSNRQIKESETGHLTSLVMPSGIIEGTETVVFYTIFFILPDHILWLFLMMSFLTATGAIQRWFWAVKNIK